MKTKALILFLAIGFSGCLPNSALVSDLEIDAGWYCNIWGSLVIHGTITNNGTQTISGVELKAKTYNADGTTTTQNITIRQGIGAGNTISFKERLSHYDDEDPNRVNVVIVDAW